MRFLLLLVLLVLLSISFTRAQTQKKCSGGSVRFGSACKKCPRGTYRSAAECVPCPIGFYNRYTGAHGLDVCLKQPCPAGTIGTVSGAISVKSCKRCPPGTSSNPGAGRCLTCEPGTRLHDFNIDDVQSPAQQQCMNCYFRTFTTARNAQTCQKCRKMSERGTRSRSCTNCPAGFGGTDVVTCSPCKTQFNDGSSTSCMDCPPGYVGSKPVADRCVPCPPGTFKTGFTGRCKPCREGQNEKATGASFCIADNAICPENYFRNTRGACQTCLTTERYVPEQRYCEPCGKDRESRGGMSTTCAACPSGRVGSRRGCVCRLGFRPTVAGSCEACPPGTRGNAEFIPGQLPACVDCEYNEFTDTPGSTRCKTCPAGSVATADGTGCVACAKGLVPGERGCVHVRTNCPPRSKRVELPNGELFSCSMKACARGQARFFVKFQGLGKVYHCADIPAGYFVRAQGAAGGNPRTECGENEVSAGGADAVCRRCADGLFRDEGDGSRCGCRRRTFEAGFGSVWRGWVGGRCAVCPAGTRSGSSGGRPACVPCAKGSFNPFRGSVTCRLCGRGSFSGVTGAQRCEKCPRGTTSYFAGSTGCTRVGSA